MTEREHDFHMVPVADTQQQVVIDYFSTIKGIMDSDSLYSQRSWVFQYIRQYFSQRNVFLR